MKKIENIGIVGAGTIGLSWITLFLAKGHNVYVYDVVPNYQETAKKRIAHMLKSLDVEFSDVEDKLHLETELAVVASHSDLIQENGPENVQFKHDLMDELEKHASDDTIIASSSSGIVATEIAKKMRHPERVIIGHPFNPPHILPLVEVSPGEKTSQKVTDETVSFYESINKKPVILNKEIPGFVANRLQTAIFQECIYVVEQGIVSPEGLDQIIENSLGIRWASGGPFKSFHLGGGPTGFAGFLEHLGGPLNAGFKHTGKVELTEELKASLIEQVNQEYGVNLEPLEIDRDEKQKAIIKILNQ